LAVAKVHEELCSTMNLAYSDRRHSLLEFINKLRSSPELLSLDYSSDNSVIQNILADVENEVLQGFMDADIYRKWGQKYACAYVKALEFQQANNFKDKVMATFTTEFGEKKREKLEEIFMSIDPPKTMTARVVDRKTFTNISYNCGGGCISCTTPLVVKRGEQIKNIPSKEIMPGDHVLTDNRGIMQFSPVLFVVLQNYDSYMINLPNGIEITPWHPMYNEDECKFVFPQESEQGRRMEYCVDFATVYDFVVENRSPIIIGKRWINKMSNDDDSENMSAMISLGHNITDDEVAQHDYLGTNAVLEDLYKLREEQGTNRVLVSTVIRDKKTNKIVKYQ
jgi:hypothetical protein